MDLRLPIGGLFTIFGMVLTVYGAVSGPNVYAPSLGINVNLYWGIVMLVFGVLMAVFGAAAQRRIPPMSENEGLSDSAPGT